MHGKIVGNHAKTLHSYKKSRVQIDANDELACWTIICRKRCKYRLPEGVIPMVHAYWVENSPVSLNVRDVVWQWITQGRYESHAKHLLEMIQVKLFDKFIKSHCDINIPIITFVKLKTWYVMSIIVRDICCCHYYVEFE